MKATELVKPGSRIRERFLLQVPESQALKPLLGELRGRLSSEGARVLTYRDAQPRIRRFLDHLSTYLGLIGLTVLFVGGIGVATTVQGFLSQKMTQADLNNEPIIKVFNCAETTSFLKKIVRWCL